MNTDMTIFRPRVGMRFAMRGANFEVCFAQFGMLRYASVNGGAPYRLTIKNFRDLQKRKEIAIQKPDLYKEDQILECGDGGYAPASLSKEELTQGLRRIRYAEAAITELLHPNSFTAISNWLSEFATRIKDANPPVPRSISAWVKIYREKGREALFAPERKRGNRTLKFSPEIHILILEAIDEYLVQKERRDARDVLSHIAGRLAEQELLDKDGETIAIPSERTIRRYLKKLDPFLLIRIKQGALAAERAARAAGKVITSPGPLHVVQIDTHFLKVFVVDPETGEVLGKPYLVCAFDVRTRCVVGIYISLMPASAATTLGAVKDMLTRPNDGLPGGIPVYLIPDNGVEFKNAAVVRVCAYLSIHFEPAQVRDPNGKAHVESFFNTLSNYLIQKLSGRTFSDLDEKGEYTSEKEATATLEDIERYVRFWIEEEYHQRIHSRTVRAPIMHWREETANLPRQGLTADDVDVIARTPYQVGIHRGRVRVEKLEFYSHALKTLEAEHKGTVTVLLNELDLSYIYVQNPYEKGGLIRADSVDPEYTMGLTLSEHIEVQKLKKKQAERDLLALGKNANLLARWQLMQMIQKDSKVARKNIAKLTNGRGRLSYGENVKSGQDDDEALPPSMVRQVTEQRRESEVPMKHISGRASEGDARANELGAQHPAPSASAALPAKSKIYRME